MTGRDPDSPIERLRRGASLVLVAVGFAALFMLLLEISRFVWHWLGW